MRCCRSFAKRGSSKGHKSIWNQHSIHRQAAYYNFQYSAQSAAGKAACYHASNSSSQLMQGLTAQQHRHV